MSDDQQWQAPDAPKAPPPPSPYSAQPPPPVVAPVAGPAPAASGPAPGWTPPPKPGLVPLRPMTLGTILGASFTVLRRNPKPVLGPAIGIWLGTYLVILFAMGAIIAASVSRIDMAVDGDDADAILAGSIVLGALGGVLTILFSIVGTAVLQGLIVAEVARATLGEKLKLRGLWSIVRPRFGALVGWAFLLSGVLTVAVAVVVGVITALVVLLGEAGIVLGVLFGLGVVFGGIVLIAWLSTKLLFVPAAIVLERRTITDAVRRSWTLVRGYFWRTFGIVLLVGAMLSVATQVVTTPISFIFSLGVPLLMPSGSDPTGAIVGVIVMYLVLFIVMAIVSAITLVIQSANSSLLYLDLRFRTEGLDLELARFVEARQSGAEVSDPYLPAAETPVPAPAGPQA